MAEDGVDDQGANEPTAGIGGVASDVQTDHPGEPSGEHSLRSDLAQQQPLQPSRMIKSPWKKAKLHFLEEAREGTTLCGYWYQKTPGITTFKGNDPSAESFELALNASEHA